MHACGFSRRNGQKADNTTSLNQSTSWANGSAPTSESTVVFDFTISRAITTTPGANLTCGHLLIADSGGNVTINQGRPTNTITLTKLAEGKVIDMSHLNGADFTLQTAPATTPRSGAPP